MTFKYYIIYSRKNKNKLKIIELSTESAYQLDDYLVASRKSFTDVNEVIKYSKELAKKHNLTVDSNISEVRKELGYIS